MTDQSFQPAQDLPTEEGSAGPFPEVIGPRGERFQVLRLDPVRNDPGLDVGDNAPDSDEEKDAEEKDAEVPSHAIGCNGVDFAATVTFTGDEAWRIGWVQTVESSDYWVLYRDGARSARYRRRLPQRMRDSDTDKGCWYGTETRKKAVSGGEVSVGLMDTPAAPFDFGGPSDTDLVGWVPTECGGEKEFWTWLVAVQEGPDHRPEEVVYLHHIHWKVVFACTIGGDAAEPTVTAADGSGVVILSEGVGQGGATPVLAGPGARPRYEVSELERLPDSDEQ